MILSYNDYNLFYKTQREILFYVAKQNKLIPSSLTSDKFLRYDLEVREKCRDILYQNDELFDEFIKHFAQKLKIEQIHFLLAYKKNRITSRFIILRCLLNFAVFWDSVNDKFYYVKALNERYDDFLTGFPLSVETTILPLKTMIIFDGFVTPSEKQPDEEFMLEVYNKYKKVKEAGKIIKMLQ